VTALGDRALNAAAGLADRIAAAAASCPGVAGLTQVPGRPVATYLPGRTVSGVAVRPAEVEICVVARYGPPLPQVAAQVRQAVEPLVPGRVVDVVIADITSPRAPPEAATAPAGCDRRSNANDRKTGESANG
jgi:uncharacterized alkaline shock family protein YloU